MYQNLALLAAFLLTYSIFAGRFESRLLNGPLMFMLAGLILGPAFLGILQPRIDKDGLRILAELTLAIVLFSDAANANLKTLKAYEGLPLRLLLLGLPLTMLSGWHVVVSTGTVIGAGNTGDPPGAHRRGAGQGRCEQSQGSRVRA
jgi:NhaP-type Na+/H+ or K+/H+ antiporter